MDENKLQAEEQRAEQTSPTAKRLTRKQMREHKQLYTPTSLRDNPEGKKLNIRAVFIIVISLLVAATVATIIIVAITAAKIRLRDETTQPIDDDPSQELNDTVYQYYDGIAVKIDSGAQLYVDENGNVVIKTPSKSSTTTLPIYIRSTRSVILTADTFCYQPRTKGGIPNCAEKLTKITCDQHNVITATHNGKTVTLDKGFLYDGNNMYLFLETVVVNYNGYQDVLPPMSFVEFVYGGKLQVFNYDTQQFQIYDCLGEGTAFTPTDGAIPDWTLQLVDDTVAIYDGSKTINYILFPTSAMSNHEFIKYLVPND